VCHYGVNLNLAGRNIQYLKATSIRPDSWKKISYERIPDREHPRALRLGIRRKVEVRCLDDVSFERTDAGRFSAIAGHGHFVSIAILPPSRTSVNTRHF
jgi:hypothetical protein